MTDNEIQAMFDQAVHHRQAELTSKVMFIKNNIHRIEEAINCGNISYDDVAFYMTDGNIELSTIESKYDDTDFSRCDLLEISNHDRLEAAKNVLDISHGYARAEAEYGTTDSIRHVYRRSMVNIIDAIIIIDRQLNESKTYKKGK